MTSECSLNFMKREVFTVSVASIELERGVWCSCVGKRWRYVERRGGGMWREGDGVYYVLMVMMKK